MSKLYSSTLLFLAVLAVTAVNTSTAASVSTSHTPVDDLLATAVRSDGPQCACECLPTAKYNESACSGEGCETMSCPLAGGATGKTCCFDSTASRMQVDPVVDSPTNSNGIVADKSEDSGANARAVSRSVSADKSLPTTARPYACRRLCRRCYCFPVVRFGRLYRRCICFTYCCWVWRY